MCCRQVWFIVLLGSLVAIAGCEKETVADVSGTVTFDGSPVADGAILFQPKDGKSSSAGSTITNGQYQCKVPFGSMSVSITASKEIGKKKLYNTPQSPEMPIMQQIIPKKYNEATELIYEVAPGKHVKNFDLTK